MNWYLIEIKGFISILHCIEQQQIPRITLHIILHRACQQDKHGETDANDYSREYQLIRMFECW